MDEWKSEQIKVVWFIYNTHVFKEQISDNHAMLSSPLFSPWKSKGYYMERIYLV